MPAIRSVIFGYESVKDPKSVVDSVILGPQAGKEHTRGERNIFIGKSAGYSSGGYENIFVGSYSGANCPGSGNIFLGNVDAPVNNTFLIGRCNIIPIVASLETGHVQMPSLTVVNDLSVGGTLTFNIPSHLIRSEGTNIGTGNQTGSGKYSVRLGEHTARHGEYVIAVGHSAGEQNKGNELVAIGTGAAAYNTGSNVIAIGTGAGLSNASDGMLFMGSFITGTPSELVMHRPLKVPGWTLEQGHLSAPGVSLTSSNLRMGSLDIGSTSNWMMSSLPIAVGKLPTEHSGVQTIVQNASGFQVDSDIVRPSFKSVHVWDHSYIGLGQDGHVYTSATGRVWKPVRSPCLTHLTMDGSTLLGFGGGSFYRYEQNAWIEEVRDEGEYECTGLFGPFALGTSLSNTFYGDSGTILMRSGTEWRLFPGVYPDAYTYLSEDNGNVYVGNEKGLFILKDREAKSIYKGPITALTKNLAAMQSVVGVLSGEAISFGRSFRTTVRWIGETGLFITDDGVYQGNTCLFTGEGYTFADLKTKTAPSTDIQTYNGISIGDMTLHTNTSGLSIENGIHRGHVYDTTFHPLPISLEGIEHLTVKNVSGRIYLDARVGGEWITGALA